IHRQRPAARQQAERDGERSRCKGIVQAEYIEDGRNGRGAQVGPSEEAHPTSKLIKSPGRNIQYRFAFPVLTPVRLLCLSCLPQKVGRGSRGRQGPVWCW